MVNFKLIAGLAILIIFILKFEGIQKTKKAITQGKALSKQSKELIKEFKENDSTDRTVEDM